MKFYIRVSSYRKDPSFVKGEIACRGIYEINIIEAKKHQVRYHGMHHPIQGFEKWTYSSFGNTTGSWYINPFGFYNDVNDLINGQNILQVSSTELMGIAWNPTVILNQVEALYKALLTSNFLGLEESEMAEMMYLIELLKEAVEENLIVDFSHVE